MQATNRLFAAGALAALLGAACVAPGTPTSSPSGPSVATGDATRADWPKSFRVGLFGGDDAEQVIDRYKPFKAYMEGKLGIPVEIFTGTSYTAVTEAMRAKRIDGIYVGPFNYILSVQEAGAEALAIGVNTTASVPKYDPSIRPTYYSVISTKKKSGIRTINDLRARSFAFVDPASTSGHLVPKTFLLNNGINADKDMRPIFAGSHATSVAALWNDKVDAAASTENTLVAAAANKTIELCFFPDNTINKERSKADVQRLYNSCPDGNIAMLAYSDPIPSTRFAVRKEMPASFKKAVYDALMAMKDDPKYVTDAKQWFLDPTKELGFKNLDEMYNPLREIAKLLNLDLKSIG